jgi:hypothetical protein
MPLRLLRWIRSHFDIFRLKLPTEDQIRAAARSRLGTCPICGEVPVGHELALVGSAIAAAESNSITRVRALIGARNWREAATLQEWHGECDDLEYKVLQCHLSPITLILYEIESYAPLELDDRVTSRRILDESESEALVAAVQLAWWTV